MQALAIRAARPASPTHSSLSAWLLWWVSCRRTTSYLSLCSKLLMPPALRLRSAAGHGCEGYHLLRAALSGGGLVPGACGLAAAGLGSGGLGGLVSAGTRAGLAGLGCGCGCSYWTVRHGRRLKPPRGMRGRIGWGGGLRGLRGALPMPNAFCGTQSAPRSCHRRGLRRRG